MRALVYTAPNQVEMQDFPDPRPGSGEVLVRVSATGICGSDVHGFLGHHARRQPGLVLGHEVVGVVEEGADDLVGRRVVVNPLLTCGACAACLGGRQNCCATWRLLGLDRTHGGFAERVAVPRRNVHPLPDHVSDAAAVMVEPLANAVHILSMVPANMGLLLRGAIFGGGTLGAAILSIALLRGLRVLAVSEPNPLRAEVVRRLGAERVLDPREADVVRELRDLTGGEGIAFAVDAVGVSATRAAAVGAVAKGGTALLLGLDDKETALDFQDIVRREVRLQGSFAYTERDFAEALALVEGGEVDFAPWTDVVPLTDGQPAFDRLVSDPGDRLKIVLTP